MEAFKQWSVGLITLPHNFKTILDKTEKPQDENNNSSDSGLKVVCVGLSRTGTSSLKAALSQLLPGRTYHAMDLLQDINTKDTFRFWKALSEDSATNEDIRQFFPSRQYSAVCDIPCLQYWKQISAAFPEARIVLTVREPSAWYKSVSTTLMPLAAQIDRWSFLLRLMCIVLYQSIYQVELLNILFRQLRQKELQQEATAIRFYQQWNEEVVAGVKPENLLIFDVRQGWDPLCKFLHLDTPEGPFPRLNDSTALVRHQWHITFLISLFMLMFVLLSCLLITGHSLSTTLLSSLSFFLLVVFCLFLWTKLFRQN